MTTHKSTQVIFGSSYTAKNDHLSNTTNNHFSTVPNILSTCIQQPQFILFVKSIHETKYSQNIYVYQEKYLNKWDLNKEKLSGT